MIVYLDPEQHGRTGASLPYWLYFENMKISSTMERRIKAQMADLLGGSGSMVLEKDQRWCAQFREGWLYLMFRTDEDRDLARLALDI